MKRLYVSSIEQKCPYKCIYCFNESAEYQKGISYTQKEDIFNGAKECEIIQPACDSELLLSANWRERLDELVLFNKNISFATKKNVTQKEVEYLSKINDRLKKVGKILNVGVTICRYEHYKEIEHYAPTPEDRIKGLRMMYEAGIGCNVIIRPLFPDCEFSDLKRIIDLTKDFTYGYLLGPLYLNDAVNEYLKMKNLKNVKIEKKRPDWNQNNEISVIYSNELSNKVVNYIHEVGQMAFDSNEDCVKTIESIVGSKNA